MGGLGLQERLIQLWRRFGTVVVVACVFLLTRALVVQAFEIPSGSMLNTLLIGDYILVSKLLYGPEIPFTGWHLPGLAGPSRGDVIVFHSPINADEDLVKRIVAVENDRVAVHDGKLWVNGVAQTEPYLMEQDFSGDMAEITVPAGHVFVMGDNRNNSGDSRLFGPIPVDSIIGKAFCVYWPISHWRTL